MNPSFKAQASEKLTGSEETNAPKALVPPGFREHTPKKLGERVGELGLDNPGDGDSNTLGHAHILSSCCAAPVVGAFLTGPSNRIA
jgi:hypothetical protein